MLSKFYRLIFIDIGGSHIGKEISMKYLCMLEPDRWMAECFFFSFYYRFAPTTVCVSLSTHVNMYNKYVRCVVM